MRESLSRNGYCKLENSISLDWIERLNKSLPEIFEKHENIRRANNNPIVSNGLAMNALIGNSIFLIFCNT